MHLLGAAALGAVLGYAGLTSSGATAATARDPLVSPYFGRWQVEEGDSRFSTRGRLYRTIDIAPCGRDFCGVSVNDQGGCGPTLFRFLGTHRDGDTRLIGHGRWGAAKKDITIDYYNSETPEEARFELNLGKGHDFGERGGSMPTFNATYSPHGSAQCRAS